LKRPVGKTPAVKMSPSHGDKANWLHVNGGYNQTRFFPGTQIDKKPSPLEIAFAGEQSIYVYVDAWQRDERRRKKSDS